MARPRVHLVYEDTKQAFTERSKSFLTNAPNPSKWWSTVKTAVFGASSSLPPLADRTGKLVWSADEKASLFSAHLDAKRFKIQCRDIFQQSHSCAPSLVLFSVAFRSSFIRSLLLHLDLYGGNDSEFLFISLQKVAQEQRS